MEKSNKFAVKHPYIFQILLSLLIGMIWSLISEIGSSLKHGMSFDIHSIWGGMVIGAVIVYPGIITLYELVYLTCMCRKDGEFTDKEITSNRFRIGYDLWCIALASVFEIVALELVGNVVSTADWYVQLYNGEKHLPIFSESMPTVLTIIAIFIVSLVVLMLVSEKKRPPLITVICISGLYIGAIFVVVLGIQLFKDPTNILFNGIIVLNILVIVTRIVLLEVKAYKPDKARMSKIESNSFLSLCNMYLNDSKYWPVVAFVVMWPVLGLMVAILALFGQAPDSAIKAFTETADYTFSTKIPPQNIIRDDHYLCTVAAGGHEKIVKPYRMGKRHGRPIVVNRQLCVANAFEQIIEEKTPRFHKVVRSFYDKYGFPVAKLIKSKYVADIVWFIMKPLEWIFLVVIYMTDVHPEDRIYSQYL